MEPAEVEQQLERYAAFLRALALDVRISADPTGAGGLLAVQLVRADGVLIGGD
ncbi:MAG: hypothetical protein H7Y32_03695, partial [Chloroflexales bacterium]|nr:hypothetical protein [Chloroflexales bacterium]